MTAISDQSSISGPWDGWLAVLAFCVFVGIVWLLRDHIARAHRWLRGGYVPREVRRREHYALIARERHNVTINHYAAKSARKRQEAQR